MAVLEIDPFLILNILLMVYTEFPSITVKHQIEVHDIILQYSHHMF